MPEWRYSGLSDSPTDRWPLRRTIPDAESWGKVRKVGPYGVFVALLGLVWWRSGTSAGQPLRREYVSALEDVAWVMSELVKGAVPFAERN